MQSDGPITETVKDTEEWIRQKTDRPSGARDGKKVDVIFGYANIARETLWWKIGSMAEKERECASLVN